jgi:hypothetical protein
VWIEEEPLCDEKDEKDGETPAERIDGEAKRAALAADERDVSDVDFIVREGEEGVGDDVLTHSAEEDM